MRSDGEDTTSGDDVVVVPEADAPDADGDGISDVFPVPGTPVDLGQTALLAPLEVTVSAIDAGPEGLMEVSMRVENVGEAADTVPDTYAVCPSEDTLVGLGTEDGDLFPLEPLPAGESVEGVLTVMSLPGCPSPRLQVRVISLEGGFDHIAEWEIPPGV